jgi:DNA-binding NarL/FixJ family response regulator
MAYVGATVSRSRAARCIYIDAAIVFWALLRKRIMRIVLADDHPKWLEMMVSLVELEFDVVATAVDGTSALQVISHHKPDVAVLDLEMPGLSGIEVTRQVMSNGHKPGVVICSAHITQEIVGAAREAGALGYVFKHNCARDLLPAIEAAGNGRPSFPPGL